MSRKFLGIVDETVKFDGLAALTMHRSVGAIPFAGRYRLIDFPLSSFRHAHVTNVAIYTKGKFRSLQDHLGNGKSWDLDRKKDGLFFLPEMEHNGEDSKVLSFDHIREHVEYLLKSKEEYVLITNAYTVAVMDYDAIVDYHIENKCDITEVYQNNKRLFMFVLKRKLLIDLVLQGTTFGYRNLIEVIDLSNDYKVCEYETKSVIAVIKSTRDYYEANMKMLERDTYKLFFSNEKPIITKTTDSPSTHYKKGAKALNSILANGIISEGTVENSIVFRSVKIGKNAYIKNSIINQKCVIGDGCIIENVILDKECIIANQVTIVGDADQPTVYKKHTKIANYN